MIMEVITNIIKSHHKITNIQRSSREVITSAPALDFENFNAFSVFASFQLNFSPEHFFTKIVKALAERGELLPVGGGWTSGSESLCLVIKVKYQNLIS